MKSAELGERVKDFFGDSIGKIFLVAFGAKIGERQHRQRVQSLLPLSRERALSCAATRRLRGIEIDVVDVHDVQFDRSNAL